MDTNAGNGQWAISDGQWAMVGMVAEQRKAISLPSCQLGESQLCFALSKV